MDQAWLPTFLIVNVNSSARCCPTVCVTRWWAGRDNAALTESTSSRENCLKTRRVPPVGCTSGERERSLSPKKQGAMGVYCELADA
jgi:hypothetical protein